MKNVNRNKNKKPKIALFHFFLKADGKGGAEKTFLYLKEFLECDFWVGGIDLEGWGKQLADSDYFSSMLWNTPGDVFYLHKESKIPIWRVLKRQLNFLFNHKINKLTEYDIVIFSYTNIFFVPQRLGQKVYQIGYCHTPPRIITDRLDDLKNRFPIILRPGIDLLAKSLMTLWTQGFRRLDLKIANSKNIQNRIKKYTNIDVDRVIWPPVDINNFKFIGQKGYYISYARLEEAKRIKIVVEAFARMPDKKLIVCSSGPLKDWLINEIETRKLKNIIYKGIVSNDELYKFVGNCIAGFYLPKNEDAGMTQCEIMAAGKPVIGVADGGLLETIEHKKHGILLNSEPTVESLMKVIETMTPEHALSYKEACENQAKKFSKKAFLEKIQKIIDAVS